MKYTFAIMVTILAASLAVGASAGEAPNNASRAKIDQPRLVKTARVADFAGTILVAQGDKILFEKPFGKVSPQRSAPHRLGQVWRWASITKQVTATIAMQEVAAGRLDLDQPILRYLPNSRTPYAAKLTPRMLMQHISGLRHTDDDVRGADDWPRFYTVPLNSPDSGVSWCEGPATSAPPADFRYGDCDFIMMGAVLEAVTGKSYPALVAERIAKPLGLRSVGMFPTARRTVPGFDAGKPESSAFRLENFGAAGALYGTTHDLFAFDRALMSGKLILPAQLDEMWTGQPRYGFAALGQWVYEASLKGCDKPSLRIIERRGHIGDVSLRNIILPDLNMVVIMTWNRAGAEEAFGEVWQQAGFTHDVLSAALCKP